MHEVAFENHRAGVLRKRHEGGRAYSRMPGLLLNTHSWIPPQTLQTKMLAREAQRTSFLTRAPGDSSASRLAESFVFWAQI